MAAATDEDETMNLYEVTNGYTSESYIRVYVWCENEERARQMAVEAFRKRARQNGDDYSNNLKVQFLFQRAALAFVTNASDSGFELGDEDGRN